MEDAKPGEPGELWIRGPTVMKVKSHNVNSQVHALTLIDQGYLNNPEATRSSITPSGWFKTGDIAVRDKDGMYAIVDRKKELIKYKGFQGMLGPCS